MIQHLNPGEVFVFGSNLIGRHGKGAAKQALQWGAKSGIGIGLQGKTYAIPTKSVPSKVLPVYRIQYYVEQFIKFAKIHSELTFLVTEIGCGLAGYEAKDIAPLFKTAKNLDNVILPESFKRLLQE